MTTQETANKLVELCRTGKFNQATDELYADSIVSVEPDHAPGQKKTEGIEAKRQKDEFFSSMVQEFHKMEASEPQVAGNHFTLTMTMDATFNDGSRMNSDEICLYRVDKEGKIEYEEFFYEAGK